VATVTTSIVTTVDRRVYSSPGAVTGARTPAPLSRLIFTDDTTVALKDAANESFVTITSTLPAHFFYRICSIQIAAFSTSVAVFTDWEIAMHALITENQVQVYNFPIMNQINYLVNTTAGTQAVKVNQDSVTNDFGCFFAPAPGLPLPSQYLIDASEGISQIVFRWLDSSTDATAATQVISHIEVDQFTVTQANAAPLNASRLNYF